MQSNYIRAIFYFTLISVCRGAFIVEYAGEVIDFPEFRRRIRMYEKARQVHHYFMALGPEHFIDAGTKGNWARFVNHSCEPNAETQKVALLLLFFIRLKCQDDSFQMHHWIIGVGLLSAKLREAWLVRLRHYLRDVELLSCPCVLQPDWIKTSGKMDLMGGFTSHGFSFGCRHGRPDSLHWKKTAPVLLCILLDAIVDRSLIHFADCSIMEGYGPQALCAVLLLIRRHHYCKNYHSAYPCRFEQTAEGETESDKKPHMRRIRCLIIVSKQPPPSPPSLTTRLGSLGT